MNGHQPKIVSYIVVALLCGLIIWSFVYRQQHQLLPTGTLFDVTNFRECVDAGYPVMESYPRQCASAGVTYIEKVDESEPSESSATIQGFISIGPNCPVEQEGVPCPPSPEAYLTRRLYVYKENKVTIAEKVPIDSTGHYTTHTSQGTYYLEVVPAGIGRGELKRVEVISGQTYTINFDIDTGIR